jgi:hypothetical protein
MLLEQVTLELPTELIRSARQVAEITGASFNRVIESTLTHGLPPLDDVPAGEIAELASLALLDDAQLWEIARWQMRAHRQAELNRLLETQNTEQLGETDQKALDHLLEEYGSTLVRSAQAYLLLARRGYRVPMQEDY